MKKISYTPAITLMHILHPFTKFALLLGISIVVFLISSTLSMIALFLILVLCFIYVNKNPFDYMGMRTTVITALMIGVIQLLFFHQGKEVIQLPGIDITDLGIQRAVLISLRFLIIVLSSYLFILTTSPSDFAYAFMQMGVPYRYAFMIITSMRLVPILSIEGERISIAQKMRGARFDFRKPRQLFYHTGIFISAVLFSLFDRVNKLAISMESRSFGRYQTRTYQNSIRFTYLDGVVAGSVLLLSLLFNYLEMKGIL